MQRGTYGASFKARVAKEAIETGNCAAVARRPEVHETLMGRWAQQYRERGEEASHGRGEDAAAGVPWHRLREIQRQNEQLKRLLGEKDLEIAILRDLVKKGASR